MSNDDIVFDASTLLAYLLNETGADVALSVMDRAVISTVNLAEVRTKLLELGGRASLALDLTLEDIRRVDPFTEEDAIITAKLRAETRHLGLSLGDRACLALGIRLGTEVYTAERAWAAVSIGSSIHVIR